MLTRLGRFLRKLRIDRGELLKDMAEKLDVSVSFLSAVENGKKRMPSEWNARVCMLYALNDTQREEFTDAIADTERTLDLSLQGISEESRRLAVSFARELPFFTLEQIEAMQRAMQKKEEDGK